MYDNRRVLVIIAAAGKGSRIKSAIPKQLIKIKGKPMLVKTTEAFEQNASVDDIIIVADKEHIGVYEGLFRDAGIKKIRNIVTGGKSRQESVFNGLKELPDHADIILIHDGARPFVTDRCIESVLATVAVKGAAAAVVPVIDTVKTGKGGRLKSNLDRSDLYAVQTPQGFLKGIITEAHTRAADEGYEGTDDAVLAERIGYDVFPAEGDFSNIKITVPEDILRLQDDQPSRPRVGMGFDAHKLAKGRRLVLCGVEIDWESGLLGHSDADVAVHALMDAILGAAALGDIGGFFPDNDQAYKDISSLILLERVMDIANGYGFTVVNADITVIAERPKLAPYIDEMRGVIARTLGTDTSNVSIKATTTEMMGFCGREEGMAALAVVIVEKAAIH